MSVRDNSIFERFYKLEHMLEPAKVLLLYGARQVGKTTLVDEFLKNTTLNYKKASGDSLQLNNVFGSRDENLILDYAHGAELIVIDEAQKIDGIGLGLKILVDNRKDIKVIATGSSSFELAQNLGEPLTGRKRTKILFPFAQLEMHYRYNRYELKTQLSDFLVYGSYPEIIKTKFRREKAEKISEIADSYLLQDVLALDKIKKPIKLVNMLKLLAYQVGSEVSMNEISLKVALDKNTVEKYIDILEKAFVIRVLRGYSNNLRKEITRKSKIFFVDNGIRNALIGNFNKIEDRNDVGQLWENFLYMERLKKRHYTGIYGNEYFWRTWDKKEIDLIEERDGKLYGYEFKWGKKLPKAPKDWLETYQNASYEVINQDNYLDFII